MALLTLGFGMWRPMADYIRCSAEAVVDPARPLWILTVVRMTRLADMPPDDQ
jgi:hypothetical protein